MKKDDVVILLRELNENLQEHPEEWENPTLDQYLEAMGAWLGAAGNRNVQPSWELIGKMLEAAKIYE